MPIAGGELARSRKGIRLNRRGPLVRGFAYLLAFLQFAAPGFAAAQSIVPDGRTQTSVSTAGKVVNVTTATVTGANAFNSFSRFSVDQGITANLFLPGGRIDQVKVGVVAENQTRAGTEDRAARPVASPGAPLMIKYSTAQHSPAFGPESKSMA